MRQYLRNLFFMRMQNMVAVGKFMILNLMAAFRQEMIEFSRLTDRDSVVCCSLDYKDRKVGGNFRIELHHRTFLHFFFGPSE